MFYLECWNIEPNNRPTIHQVAIKLKEIIAKGDISVSNEQIIAKEKEINLKHLITTHHHIVRVLSSLFIILCLIKHYKSFQIK